MTGNMRRRLFHGALWIRNEEKEDTVWAGYGEKTFLNRKYFSNLRIEKLDAETGEPILHDDAVFESIGRKEMRRTTGMVPCDVIRRIR